MRSDDLRTLPDGFLQAYRSRFRCDPPGAFVEAYAAVAETLWFGAGGDDPEGRKRGKRSDPGYWFAEERLLGPKLAADKLLAGLARRLKEA